MKTNLPVARSARLGLLLAAVITVQPIVEAHAQSDPGPHRETRQNIPDVELVDQDGKTVHLYSDLLKGRVAALSFIFTTCQVSGLGRALHRGDLRHLSCA